MKRPMDVMYRNVMIKRDCPSLSGYENDFAINSRLNGFLTESFIAVIPSTLEYSEDVAPTTFNMTSTMNRYTTTNTVITIGKFSFFK